jgi:hypothetical protein
MEESGKTIHTEVRQCVNSFQCSYVKDIKCKSANKTGKLKKCEVGCCEGDLCNSGGPIPPQPPKPTGPSGMSLHKDLCLNLEIFLCLG